MRPEDLKTLLIGLIESARERIQVTIYRFTLDDLAQALIKAHLRGSR